LNHLTRYRARWKLFSELSSPDDDKDFVETVPAPAQSDRFDETERKRLLDEALRRLPDCQRVPLVLYHFEDLAYDEIASRLGASLSKIKTDIHRGRLALKRYLEPVRDEIDPLGQAARMSP
jgi:RNA polymerase sigma-70 factor (ECF subfamily)